MTNRIYSLDPEQNAELAAQHGMEARLTGVSVDTYWAASDHDGDYEDDRPFEYTVTVYPIPDSDATIIVIVDAYDEDEAVEKVKDIYDDCRIGTVEVTG